MSTRILREYTEALTGRSHVYTADGLDNTLLFQGYILEVIPGVGTVGGMYILGSGGEEPMIAWIQLQDPLHDL